MGVKAERAQKCGVRAMGVWPVRAQRTEGGQHSERGIGSKHWQGAGTTLLSYPEDSSPANPSACGSLAGVEALCDDAPGQGMGVQP